MALDGVRALVTGGTSGLGLAMARALAEVGAEVALTGRLEQRAAAAAGTLAGLPGPVMGVAMDVRDAGDVEAGVQRVLEGLGGLDVLVNNAGIGMRTVNPSFLTDPRPFWAVTPEGFRDVLDTNLTGYFLVARAVVPHLVEAGAGRVVNVSMNHETMRRAGFVPYGPSRAGAESLSRIMAADLAGTGVTVNQLLPGGATATGMIPDELPEERRQHLLDPAIMAEPIRWLCSSAADGLHDERIVALEFQDWLARRGDASSA